MPLTLKVTLGPCYDAVAEQIEAKLQPIDVIEVLLAAQIVRAHWRIERCERAADSDHPDIDRIRHRAEISIRRNMAELRQLQADRYLKAELNLDLPRIARVKDVVNFANSKKRTQPVTPVAQVESKIAAVRQKEADIQSTNLKIRTQSVGRNTPCPCHSGQKYKRCCGKGAPPILNLAA
jgi:uncharacterized protein YchJ